MKIAVTSELTLVAESIAAALASRGARAVVTPWTPGAGNDATTGVTIPQPRPAEPHVDLALVMGDLGSRARIDEVCDRGRRCHVPWVVIADCDPGPAWGAVLEAGARAVVPSSVSLDDLLDALYLVSRGDSPHGVAERIALLREWRAAEHQRQQLLDRMRSLSPREQTVLGMLYEGTTVHAIAERLDVSEATVRSQVRAVLRKLAVASQLAAVAAVGELREQDRPPP